MHTTKRPIILTTSDPGFLRHFDPRGELHLETLTFRTPPLVSICIFLFKYDLTEILHTPRLTQLEFKPMTSRPCPWDTRFNHWAIKGFSIYFFSRHGTIVITLVQNVTNLLSEVNVGLLGSTSSILVRRFYHIGSFPACSQLCWWAHTNGRVFNHMGAFMQHKFPQLIYQAYLLSGHILWVSTQLNSNPWHWTQAVL